VALVFFLEGSIEVEREAGKGTIFVVKLPTTRASQPEMSAEEAYEP
jgi:chemotaxis protein histidine kinase CheA